MATLIASSKPIASMEQCLLMGACLKAPASRQQSGIEEPVGSRIPSAIGAIAIAAINQDRSPTICLTSFEWSRRVWQSPTAGERDPSILHGWPAAYKVRRFATKWAEKTPRYPRTWRKPLTNNVQCNANSGADLGTIHVD